MKALIWFAKFWERFMLGCQNLKACETWLPKLLNKFSNLLCHFQVSEDKQMSKNHATPDILLDNKRCPRVFHFTPLMGVVIMTTTVGRWFSCFASEIWR